MDRQLRQVSRNQKLSTAKSTKLAKKTQIKPLAPSVVEDPVPIGKLAKIILVFLCESFAIFAPFAVENSRFLFKLLVSRGYISFRSIPTRASDNPYSVCSATRLW